MSSLRSQRSVFLLILLLACYTGHVPASADTVHLILPDYRIQASELAVIVNDSDPLSVRIGAYYQQARHIPDANMIHVAFKPGRGSLTAAEFQPVRQQILAATPAAVQAYALTWAAPYRVECMSITSALTFGFDKTWCSGKLCAATRLSPLFRYTGARPYDDHGVRPSISLAAGTFAAARELIDRGIAADASQPDGTAYLLSTSDKARNVRAKLYPRLVDRMHGWIETLLLVSDVLQERDDVLFYFTGLSHVTRLDSLQFRPGAIADHLTSSGGRLTGRGQMSALRWLEAGATGSYGTVVEPCNLPGKFPNPALVMEAYGSGRSLIQAYWQSVSQPGEGIFIGEPLASPWAGEQVHTAQQHIILDTRSLLPGFYQLAYSPYPVGPYRILPTPLVANYHQTRFTFPLAGAGYYRIQAMQ